MSKHCYISNQDEQSVNKPHYITLLLFLSKFHSCEWTNGRLIHQKWRALANVFLKDFFFSNQLHLQDQPLHLEARSHTVVASWGKSWVDGTIAALCGRETGFKKAGKSYMLIKGLGQQVNQLGCWDLVTRKCCRVFSISVADITNMPGISAGFQKTDVTRVEWLVRDTWQTGKANTCVALTACISVNPESLVYDLYWGGSLWRERFFLCWLQESSLTYKMLQITIHHVHLPVPGRLAFIDA